MAADPAFEFVDANVLVYAFDASAGVRHEASTALMERLWASGGGCLSIQVLQEFFVTVTRKVKKPLSIDEAADHVRDLSVWKIYAPDVSDVLAAAELHKRARINFWDAMVLRAAGQSGCTIVWTEDLKDGQSIQGVTIRNPFS